jgi:hypothetical protein
MRRAPVVLLILLTAPVRADGTLPQPCPMAVTSLLPAQAVTVRPLGGSAPDRGFANLGDLDWLRPVAPRTRVFLFGETHYNRIIDHLGARMLFALNTFDHFGLLSLELPYSATAFFDRYVTMADDTEAAGFRRDTLRRFLTDEETGELLDDVRRWNRLHRDKIIHVGAHDLEHDWPTTITAVLAPFFHAAGVSCPWPDAAHDRDLGPEIEVARRCLARVKGQGGHAFLTLPFATSVVANLESYWQARIRERDDTIRQRAIVRNLTDPAFLGRSWQGGKLFLWGGSHHAGTHLEVPDGEAFMREGTYFDRAYPSTRGKTFSVVLASFGVSLDRMAGVDLTRYNHVGSGYRDIVTMLQQARVDPTRFYLTDRPLTELDRLLLSKARPNDPALLVEGIDWPRLLDRGRSLSAGVVDDIEDRRQEYSRYDALIIVPRSPLTRAVPRLARLPLSGG